ncbi:putative ubiquitin carboxyl-terminal hydrolase 5 [Astathelohania contejeani]|uniref:Ubiquitin carboxyl-terminal hydrolase 5 n=1 Tax=Astathelohania contejeani TaxID=164912 RepID=A0ABQ7I2A2_9MICR|nr:putative ubiquitin carboxyl-terminal hydrolase 5 [Thelohania contejeani]
MDLQWQTSIPQKDNNITSDDFIAAGRTWRLILSNRDQLYLTLEYIGSSYFDIISRFTFFVNDNKIDGTYTFSRCDNEFTIPLGGYEAQETPDINITKPKPSPLSCDSDDMSHTTTSSFPISSSTVCAPINIKLYLTTRRNDYHSKEETGHVGLRNLGATCYMSTFIQTLFNMHGFTNSVLKLSNIPEIRPLQELFCQLHQHPNSVDPRGFIQETQIIKEIHEHQDIHEFAKLFFDTIEKHTKKESDFLAKLFQGEAINYIKSECGCVREIKEKFEDIQLELRDFFNNTVSTNLRNSLQRYVKPEILDGDNKYQCDKHGYVKAEKGVLFSKLPPVLFILLKRFGVDFETGEGYKVNDWFEYPKEIDMGEFMKKKENDGECSEEGDKYEDNIYKLYSIAVHSGETEDGHYYAILNLNNRWIKFNDTLVTEITELEAMRNNFGGVYPHNNKPKRHSAYLLTYVKQSQWNKIINEPIQIFEPLKSLSTKKEFRVRVIRDIIGYNGLGICNMDNYDYILSNTMDLIVSGIEEVKDYVSYDKRYCYFFTADEIKYKEDLQDGGKYYAYCCNEEYDFKDKHFLLFVKTYETEGDWCRKVPTGELTLKAVIPVKKGDIIRKEDIKRRIGWEDECVFQRESDNENNSLDDFSINSNTIIIISKEKHNFIQTLKNKKCINFLILDGRFPLFVERSMTLSELEEEVRSYLMCDEITLHGEGNVGDISTYRNTIRLSVDNSYRLVYLSCGGGDLNGIRCLHVLCLKRELRVSQLVTRLLARGCECMSEAVLAKMFEVDGDDWIKGLRVVDTLRDTKILRVYGIDDVFTSEGMCVLIGKKKENEIKCCYCVYADASYKVIGYPFLLAVDKQMSVSEFRQHYNLTRMMLRFDGFNYREMEKDEVMEFGEEEMLFIKND